MKNKKRSIIYLSATVIIILSVVGYYLFGYTSLFSPKVLSVRYAGSSKTPVYLSLHSNRLLVFSDTSSLSEWEIISNMKHGNTIRKVRITVKDYNDIIELMNAIKTEDPPKSQVIMGYQSHLIIIDNRLFDNAVSYDKDVPPSRHTLIRKLKELLDVDSGLF